jgi:hypothetical protein
MDQKTKLSRSDITLEFVFAREVEDDFKLDYIIHLRTSIPASQIDNVSLRNAIKESMQPIDIKYMILKSFNTGRVTFFFDHELWMRDATKGIKPVTKFTNFSRTFKFKVDLPDMLLEDVTKVDLTHFLVKIFKKYLLTAKDSMKWFKRLFSKGLRNAISESLPARFRYAYDYQDNSMTMHLRPFWIMALLYGVGEALKYRERMKVEDIDFESLVKKLVEDHLEKSVVKYVTITGTIKKVD